MKRVLVANRGEIACRIIRTLQAEGFVAIAVYSQADADAPHVAMSDQAICLGPAPAMQSYLSAVALLDAAKTTRAQGIHPGYGFLSENADFAQAVEDAGLIFIGPDPQAIRKMGDKATARQIMEATGVPCVPGYDAADQSDTSLAKAADKIGYPVMIKAAAGGGGRGMRLVTCAQDFQGALSAARAEALAGFGSEKIVLEKAVTDARHIEFQILADSHGATLHLGERDCSLQRRHQKVIEEAPAPGMTAELRRAMGDVAVKAARAVKYRGAGTVEFLLAENGAFYFLEMNTRLQVEHPVTELVTGLDIVSLQLKVARGEALDLKQEEIEFSGHAIEARLYAEDPADGFLPSTGKIERWEPAQGPGIRVDAGIATGGVVSPFYDPMLAKIIAHGSTRAQALSRLKHAVRETVLLGPKTNSAFLCALLSWPEFQEGRATTSLLDERMASADIAQAQPSDLTLCLTAALALETDRAASQRTAHQSSALLGWSSAPLPPHPVTLQNAQETHSILATANGSAWQMQIGSTQHRIEILPDNIFRVESQHLKVIAEAYPSGDVWIAQNADRFHFTRPQPGQSTQDPLASGHVLAPLSGKLTALDVKTGDLVQAGNVIALMEAMKMQHKIVATMDAKVQEIHALEGAQLAKGGLIVMLSPSDQGET